MDTFFSNLNPAAVRAGLKSNSPPKMNLRGEKKATNSISLSQNEEKGKVHDLSSKIKILKSVSVLFISHSKNHSFTNPNF